MTVAAHSLCRLFASLAGRNLIVQPRLKLDWHRKPTSDCTTFELAEPVDPGKGVQPCDQLWLSCKNNSGRDLDVSILYFNADFSIAPLWPKQGLSNRLAAAESGKAGFQIDPDSHPANEEILVLAIPVEAGAECVDLTALVDPAVTRGGADWFSDHLAPNATTTRSFFHQPRAIADDPPTRADLPRAKGRRMM